MALIFLDSAQWIEFFKWLVETDGGIITLTTLILGLVGSICLGIRQIRNAIVDAIKSIKAALKNK